MNKHTGIESKKLIDNYVDNNSKYDYSAKAEVTISLKQIKQKSPEELQAQSESLCIENISCC